MPCKEYLVEGQKFGRLSYLSEGTTRTQPNGKKVRYVICRCDCGKVKEVGLAGIKRGQTVSCGCRQQEVYQALHEGQHKMTGTRIYHIRENMVQRCGNLNRTSYKNYGGKGVRVEWGSFTDFYEDMGESYKEGLTIDRIDNDGNYCKENCRWATRKQQARNKSSNINYKGKCVMDWCNELGINHSTVYKRMNRWGWSVERALGLED